MTIQEFAEKYMSFKDINYIYSDQGYIHKSRREARGYGGSGFIFEREDGQMACYVNGGGGFLFDPRNPIEAARAVRAIGFDHWRIWRRYGRKVDWRDREAWRASQREWLLALYPSLRRCGHPRHEGVPQIPEAA